MIKVFDTHAHLDDKKYDEDRESIISKCQKAGVSHIINCGCDIHSSIVSVELANAYDFIYASVGIHPHDAKIWDDTTAATLKELSKNPKAVAIGEIGLDYFYDYSPRDIQKDVFLKQINLAYELKKPIIIHVRDAYEDAMNILKDIRVDEYGCVMHSYSGSVELARECIKRGYFLSIGGPITFKNNRKTIEVVEYTPLDRLFIETDSPYLTPEPFRGKRNAPFHVIEVAKKIAQIKDLTVEEVVETTTSNAKRFFGIE